MIEQVTGAVSSLVGATNHLHTFCRQSLHAQTLSLHLWNGIEKLHTVLHISTPPSDFTEHHGSVSSWWCVCLSVCACVCRSREGVRKLYACWVCMCRTLQSTRGHLQAYGVGAALMISDILHKIFASVFVLSSHFHTLSQFPNLITLGEAWVCV